MPATRPFPRIVVSLFAIGLVAGCSGVVSSPGTAIPVQPTATSSAAAVGVATPTARLSPEPSPATNPSVSPAPTDSPEPSPAPTPSPTLVAGCGTGEAWFLAHREQPSTLQFGGATIEFTGAGFGMRDGSYVAGDSIPGGLGLSRNEIAVVVGPGEHIILRGAGVTLVDGHGAASPWSQVVFEGGLADLRGPAIGLPERTRSDGSLSISAPNQVGDWAVAFLPHWLGPCELGDGTAYARIKVR